MKKYAIGILVGLIISLTATAFAGWGRPDVEVFTDADTQIQYLIVREYDGDGVGVGICPSYTSSGNVMYVGSEIKE